MALAQQNLPNKVPGCGKWVVGQPPGVSAICIDARGRPTERHWTSPRFSLSQVHLSLLVDAQKTGWPIGEKEALAEVSRFVYAGTRNLRPVLREAPPKLIETDLGDGKFAYHGVVEYIVERGSVYLADIIAWSPAS